MAVGLQLFSELQNGITDLFIKGRAFQGFLEISDPERFGRQRGKMTVRIYRLLSPRAIKIIWARNYFQHLCYIGNIVGENAYLIERRGVGNKPVTGNAAVCRFKPYHATEICRLANGAAGIASQANHTLAGL